MTAHARTTDPSTSHEAAQVASPRVAASQAAVRHVLTAYPMPLTDPDISEAARYLGYQYSDSRLRTARLELEDMGLVVAAGTVRPEGRRTRFTLWKLRETS